MLLVTANTMNLKRSDGPQRLVGTIPCPRERDTILSSFRDLEAVYRMTPQQKYQQDLQRPARPIRPRPWQSPAWSDSIRICAQARLRPDPVACRVGCKSRNSRDPGFYMWAVGRGKTWLMDTFLRACRGAQTAHPLPPFHAPCARRAQGLTGQSDPLNLDRLQAGRRPTSSFDEFFV